MSLVSRKRSEGFDSPPGCQKFKFTLSKSQLSMDTCPVMEFVQKYSSTFLHVEIKVEYIHRSEELHLITKWCWDFIVFLRILTSNSQLISIKFMNLTDCFEHIDTPTYADICRTIVDFLGSQHRLEKVEFIWCLFGFHEGIEFLRKLTENSKESLTHLGLLGFVRYEPMDKVISSFDDSLLISPSTAAQNLPLIFDLPSLKTLEIDYSLIFEKMVARLSTIIHTLKNCQTLVLSKILLYYRDGIMSTEGFPAVTSSDWRSLKMLCPDLQVEFSIFSKSPSRRVVEFLIVPNMPIKRLEFSWGTPVFEMETGAFDIEMETGASDMEMETGAIFGHLLACKTYDHLVSLDFDLCLPIPTFASTFVPFLQACRKLKSLQLTVVYPANGIGHLMQSWLENRPKCLEKVRIKISKREDSHDYANLMSLASELKLRGLNIRVGLCY